jgi:hypothetical protein
MSLVKTVSTLVCAFALIFLFCSKNPVNQQTGENNDGEAVFHFVADAKSNFKALAHHAIARVTTPEMDTITQSLTVDTLSVSGKISNIPAGFNRKFEVTVYTDSNTICYYGKAYMDVIGGKTVNVSLTLYQYAGTGDANINGKIIDSIPPVPNIAPIVSITSPANNSEFIEGDTILVSASANDSDGTIESVSFYNGSTLLANDTIAPFTYYINYATAGAYSFKCVAYDNSGDTGVSTTVNVTVAGIVNIPPTVTITSPANNSEFIEGDTILVSASASDSDGTIGSVSFYNGTTLLANDTIAPFTYSISNATAGAYSFKCVAYDNSGDSGVSTTVNVTVAGIVNIPPTVTITSPANNSEFNTGDTIIISASASDTDGTIGSVSFYSGTTLLAYDAIAPFTCNIDNAAAGAYSFKCVAYDNSGDSGVSTTVNVTVGSIVNIPPTVTITSPANNSEFNTGDTIIINASASDTDGTIGSVSFYNGTTLLANDTIAPFTCNIDNATAGAYSFKCVAYDNSGDSGVSTTVNVTVADIVNIPPTVTITSPANDSEFIEGDTILVSASASDTDGTIKSVSFYNGTTLLVNDTIAPYTCNISNAVAGNYTFSCVAYDNSGDSSVSTIVNVTVVSGSTLLTKYGVPTANPFPSMDKRFTSIVTEGTGAPSMSQVSLAMVNWSQQNNGLYSFGMNTNNGVPSWWIDFLPKTKHTFDKANPGCTIDGSGFTGFDGEYYVTMNGQNLVMVEKTGKYAVIFKP